MKRASYESPWYAVGLIASLFSLAGLLFGNTHYQLLGAAGINASLLCVLIAELQHLRQDARSRDEHRG